MDGQEVFVRPGTADQAVFDEVFGSREYAIELVEPRLIIDAGAHIGLASVYFASRFPKAKVIALEPEESNYQLLLRNVANHSNVVPVQAGLWSHATRLSIENPEASTWGFRVVETPNAGGCAALGVCDVIGKYCDGRKVDLLKIDIEGSEVEVLASSATWLDRVDRIVVELHDRFRPGCSDALDRAIAGGGFSKSMLDENVVLVQRLPRAIAASRDR